MPKPANDMRNVLPADVVNLRDELQRLAATENQRDEVQAAFCVPMTHG